MKTCSMCKGVSFRQVYRDYRLEVVQCVHCGLVQQRDYAEALERALARVRTSESKNAVSYYESYSALKQSELNIDYEKISKTRDIQKDICDTLRKGHDLLDVGCGKGEFLSAFQRHGFNLVGVEPDSTTSSFARKHFGLAVQTGFYTSSQFPSESFHAITFIQVLEHVEDPLSILSLAYRHLKVNGLCVIDVPSYNNPRFLVYRLTRLRGFVKRDFIPTHSFYYTPRTLSQLVEKAGFKIEKLVTGRYAVKLSVDNVAIRLIDKVANSMGIGGITLYATKPAGPNVSDE